MLVYVVLAPQKEVERGCGDWCHHWISLKVSSEDMSVGYVYMVGYSQIYLLSVFFVILPFLFSVEVYVVSSIAQILCIVSLLL